MRPQATVLIPLVLLAGVAAAAGLTLSAGRSQVDARMLHVSFDPTRELYRQVNDEFAPRYLRETGEHLSIQQSHGGSGSQARSVLEGLPAQVVSLALRPDIEVLRDAKLIADDWETRTPNRACPYHSTIVFVVRDDLTAKVEDWDDLIKGDLKIIAPNPKTGGGARVAFMAAWCSAVRRGMSEDEADETMRQIFLRVPVLDTSARAATVTFARRGIGDVHLAWENEALLEARELKGKLRVIYPRSGSIRADLPATWVDGRCPDEASKRRAEAYVRHLYEPETQRLMARHFYRPSDKDVAREFAHTLPEMEMFALEDYVKGGWKEAQKRFFGNGGVFDRIYQR